MMIQIIIYKYYLIILFQMKAILNMLIIRLLLQFYVIKKIES
nr:MAG TPA: hypothetical protein [Caudoviricetes sp.]